MSKKPNVERKRRPRSKRIGDQTKPRVPTVWVDFGKDQVLSGISPPNERGELIFYGEDGKPVVPVDISVGTTYERRKGRKTVTRAQANPAKILLNVNQHLQRYDWVFAVDTNTRRIDADAVSVTAAILLREIEITDQTWSAKLAVQSFLEVRDAQVPPERLGWWHHMFLIEKVKLSGQIALFVDSELDELAAINARIRPVLRDYNLPDNVTLLYASSDVGATELIGNKALRECDRYSSALMVRIEAGDQGAGDLKRDLPGFCKAYRLWPAPP